MFVRHSSSASPRRSWVGCQTFGFAHSSASTGRSTCAGFASRRCPTVRTAPGNRVRCGPLRIESGLRRVRPDPAVPSRNGGPRACQPFPTRCPWNATCTRPPPSPSGHSRRRQSAPQQTVALSSRPQAGLRGEEERQLSEVRRHLVPFPVGQLDRLPVLDLLQLLWRQLLTAA